jgi:riboflavin kinase / FMN adenylyltransferase
MKIKGLVIKGRAKGKKLGFPTANVKLDKKLESGVFAGTVILGEKKYKAAIFVGSEGDILEAHILDFSGDLYGKEIEVIIKDKLRDIKRFNSDEELVEQIKKDIKICSLES